MANSPAVIKKKEYLELSCREVRLMVKLVSLDTDGLEMSEEAGSAAYHYWICKECQKIGLSEILNHPISCKDAISVWVRKLCHLGLRIEIKTLRDVLALEHVWGRSVKTTEFGTEHINPNFEACNGWGCTALRAYWHSVPYSCHNDCEGAGIYVISLAYKIFQHEEWSINDLLAIYENRFELLIKHFRKGEPRPFYNNLDLIESELETYFDLLRNQLRQAKD